MKEKLRRRLHRNVRSAMRFLNDALELLSHYYGRDYDERAEVLYDVEGALEMVQFARDYLKNDLAERMKPAFPDDNHSDCSSLYDDLEDES